MGREIRIRGQDAIPQASTSRAAGIPAGSMAASRHAEASQSTGNIAQSQPPELSEFETSVPTPTPSHEEGSERSTGEVPSTGFRLRQLSSSLRETWTRGTYPQTVEDLEPLPPLIMPSSSSDSEDGGTSPRTRTRGLGPDLAGIPAEAATTRARRVGMSADEIAARTDRLRRVRARIQQARERTAAIDSLTESTAALADFAALGTPAQVSPPHTIVIPQPQRFGEMVTSTSPTVTASAGNTAEVATNALVDARRVADLLERIAADIRRQATPETSENIDIPLTDATLALRRLESASARRTRIVWQRVQAAGSSPEETTEERQMTDQILEARVATARARVATHTERLHTISPAAPPLEGRPARAQITEDQINARIQAARARVAANRSRLAEVASESSAMVLNTSSGRAGQQMRRIRPLPAYATAGSGNLVTIGRNQDLSANLEHDGQSSRRSHASLSDAQVRHRQRGYHREDANGDAIDSDNEDEVELMGGSGALQRLWRQIEQQARAATPSSSSAISEDALIENKSAMATSSGPLGSMGCVGR